MSEDVKARNIAWESLFTAHTLLIRKFQDTDIWQDLSMREYDVLYTLSKASEPMRLNTLKENVLLSQPALSRLVDRLVARGLVAREIDGADRRAVSLSLTTEGRKMQRTIGKAHGKDVASAMSCLDTAELETLRTLCAKLATNAA